MKLDQQALRPDDLEEGSFYLLPKGVCPDVAAKDLALNYVGETYDYRKLATLRDDGAVCGADGEPLPTLYHFAVPGWRGKIAGCCGYAFTAEEVAKMQRLDGCAWQTAIAANLQ